MKKKLGLSLGVIGSMTVTFAPLAALVSCETTKTYDIKNSTSTDDEILNKLFDYWQQSSVIQAGSSQKIDSADSTKGIEQIKKYWNKPEGDAIRISAITSALGKLWDKNSDKIISAIVKGGVYSVKKDQLAKVKVGAYEVTEADLYVNEYKVYLLNNIRNFVNENHLLESLQKFDGFLAWIVDSANEYQNMKETLVGGKITNEFLVGIQNELNSDRSDDKKVKVYPGKMGPAVALPSTVQVVNGGTEVKQSPLVKKTITQAEQDAFYQEKYDLIKPQLNSNPTGWIAKAVTDVNQFKKYLLETTDETIISGDHKAKDLGEVLRGYVMKGSIADLWGVKLPDALSAITMAALTAFGLEATDLEDPNHPGSIANIEKSHTTDIHDYISFMKWMFDSQEKYSNLRGLCGSPTDAKMKKFQEEMAKNSTDPNGKGKFDLFA